MGRRKRSHFRKIATRDRWWVTLINDCPCLSCRYKSRFPF